MAAGAAGSLTDALERINSEQASSISSGLDALRDWLNDARNVQRADAEGEIYPGIVNVLLRFMKRQVESLVRAGGKKVT